MRELNDYTITRIDDVTKTLKVFIAVELFFPFQTFRSVSLPYNLEIGGQWFASDGGLTYYEPPKFSSAVNKASYKVSLSDLSGELQAHLRAKVSGSTMRIRAGFYHDGETPNGAGMILLYQGAIDDTDWLNDFETKTVTLVAGSPMARLDYINSRDTSKASQARFNENDTCFDYIFEDKEAAVKWGKR